MNLNIYLNPGSGLRKHEENEDGEGEGKGEGGGEGEEKKKKKKKILPDHTPKWIYNHSASSALKDVELWKDTVELEQINI